MGAIHELLAVEKDAEKETGTAINELVELFKKTPMFLKAHKSLKMYDDNVAPDFPEEFKEMSAKVLECLDRFKQVSGNYYDIIYQKGKSNQSAKADVIIDGVIIIKNVPVSVLLDLESKLSKARQVYESIPVLPAGNEWEKDESLGDGIYKLVHDEKTSKTEKTFKHKVLCEPTPHHPAQIEKWQETIVIGIYTKKIWCSMISASDKAKLLQKFDQLLIAIKKARQRANQTEADTSTIGDRIFNFIHS